MTAMEQWRPAAAEVVVQADPTENLMAWARAAQAAHELATPLCQTSFVPAHFQGKPAEATAAILYGAEAGLSPLQALQGVYVISGKPAMYARTLMAVVLSAGHEVWTESESESRVIVCGRRRGSDQVERAVWTYDRAKKAGYTKNSKYQTDPQAMLLARAQSDICRRVAPDALLGMAYSVEELQDADEDAPAPVKRTVKRQSPAATEPASQSIAPVTPVRSASQSVQETASVAAGLPPLPGEMEPGRDNVLRAVEDTPLPEPEPTQDRRPGGITGAQSRMMFALLKDAGLSERADRLDYCRTVIGREVESSSDLTRGEAQQILDRLVELTTADDPEPGFDDEPHPDEFTQLPYKDD